jgi:arginase family enzyme
VLLFSDRPHQLTGHELETLGRLHLRRVEIDEVARDPEGAAAAALELIEPRCERFVIHFDVDVFDCNNAPLSEARSQRGAAFALASPSA